MSMAAAKVGLVSVGTALFLFALTNIWNLEEPSRWSTFACLSCVTAAGSLLIVVARLLGIVRSTKAWGLAFLAKLLLALLLVKFSWLLPLDNYQRSASSADQLSYDLYGKELADAGLSANAIENVVRGDTKAMFWYVGCIYYTFGVSTLYVGLVNCLWPLIAFLSLTGIVRNFDSQPDWQALRWGLFLPEMSFYDATPGKDSISMGATYLALFCFLMLVTGKTAKAWFAILFGASMAVLAWFRPDMTVVVSAILALYWFFDNRIGKLKALSLAAGIVLVALYATPIGQDSMETKMSLARDTLVNNESADPARRGVLTWLTATSPTDMVLKTPLRCVVFLYGPYPRILPDIDRLKEIGSDPSVGIQEVYQKLTAMLIVIGTPWIAATMALRGGRRGSLSVFFAATVLVLLLAGTSVTLLIHLRYRTQLDPALLAAAVAGHKYCREPKLASLWYALSAVGSVAYYLWIW